jgi:hypothetical protein
MKFRGFGATERLIPIGKEGRACSSAGRLDSILRQQGKACAWITLTQAPLILQINLQQPQDLDLKRPTHLQAVQ